MGEVYSIAVKGIKQQIYSLAIRLQELSFTVNSQFIKMMVFCQIGVADGARTVQAKMTTPFKRLRINLFHGRPADQ
jgi:hypothetical protein